MEDELKAEIEELHEELELMGYIREEIGHNDLCSLYYLAMSVIANGSNERISVVHNEMIDELNRVGETEDMVVH